MQAQLKVTNRLDHRWTIIKLDWVFAGSYSFQMWECPPGWLRSPRGYWADRWYEEALDLFDKDDKWIFRAEGMKVNLIGYPFGGLTGDKGDFSVLASGGLLLFGKWELLSI